MTGGQHRDVITPRLDFAPGDSAVAIVVQPQRPMHVRGRDVPRDANIRIAHGAIRYEIARARCVCLNAKRSGHGKSAEHQCNR
jgi:hypothetical protein